MNRIYGRYDNGRPGSALLLLRFIVGLAFIFHGWPKVTGLAGFAAGAHLPLWLAGIAAYTELIGGALLILGLLTPLAAFFLAFEMLVALVMVHLRAGHPFVNPQGHSFESAILYLFIMLAFLLTGPGAYSLDAQLAGRGAEAERGVPVAGRRRGFA
jgi:putative oxidoreductase